MSSERRCFRRKTTGTGPLNTPQITRLEGMTSPRRKSHSSLSFSFKVRLDKAAAEKDRLEARLENSQSELGQVRAELDKIHGEHSRTSNEWDRLRSENARLVYNDNESFHILPIRFVSRNFRGIRVQENRKAVLGISGIISVVAVIVGNTRSLVYVVFSMATRFSGSTFHRFAGLFWIMTVSAKVWIDWSPEYRGRVGNDLGTDRERGTGETNKDLREID